MGFILFPAGDLIFSRSPTIPGRPSREGGNPCCFDAKAKMDSRLRALLSGKISNRLYRQLRSHETLQPRLPSFPRRRESILFFAPEQHGFPPSREGRPGIMEFCEKLNRLPEKKMKPKHLQHLPRVAKIFPGQQCAFAGMTAGEIEAFGGFVTVGGAD